MLKKQILLMLLFYAPSLAFAQVLFPEDGSQRISTWYHTNKEIRMDVLEAFENHGIKTQYVSLGFNAYGQDVFLFDEDGNFLVPAPIPALGKYFSDLTSSLYENTGSYGQLFYVQKQRAESIFDTPIRELKYSFFEGGGLISGKFKDGSSYALMTNNRFLSLYTYYRDTYQKLSPEEFKAILATELSLKPENLVVLDLPNISSMHIDLYIKALPNGVLLIDDPIEYENFVLQENQNMEYYEELFNSSKWANYKAHIAAVNKKLEKQFQLVPVVGRAYTLEPYYNSGNLHLADTVNYFNSVSGIDAKNQSFFITNRSNKAMIALEKNFVEAIKPFGFQEQHIYFVGDYSEGAGLDCDGAPAP